ncbi:MAG: HAMP domain-containing histidine kinase [Oscillospiraceae bacterium]|nr:HAMP domain-containing histidine kinase [Oscillospiraceae bacterium]
MDKTERLLSNRASRRILLMTVLLVCLSCVIAWFFSGMLADHLMAEEIRTILAVAGGGSFTAYPEGDSIRAGAELYQDYGISESMSPRLMAGYADLRMHLFCVMAAGFSVLCCIYCLAALRETDRISKMLEELRMECIALTEMQKTQAMLPDQPLSSVHRLGEQINRLAARMQYFNRRLDKEKAYLRDFLTDFSHQIKNILAGVRLSSDMLTELEHLSDQQRETLSREMDQQLDAMEQLTFSALRLAKLNADAVEYEMSEKPLLTACENVLKRMASQLREAKIIAEMDAADEGLLRHDPVWMEEAIGNLIKNAVDHARCSRISLHLETIPGAVKLIVSDDGCGIPQQEIPHLFERFGHKRKGHDVRSVGIGLAITRQIIEAHGGVLAVYSEPGHGTQIEILLFKSDTVSKENS